jgi:hypothetical protein
MTENSAFEKAVLAWREDRLKDYATSVPPAVDGRIVLGCVVFGNLHVERFLRFCVPSLLAPGNVGAIAEPILVIHTDGAHAEMIRTVLGRFDQRAQFDVHVIPDEVMGKATGADRFALVSAATTIQMHAARSAGAAFHMLVPDHVYATGFFRNLMRLADEGHQVIVGGAISADVNAIGHKLSSVECAVEPKMLNAWGMDALHPQFRALIKNGRDDFPYSTLYLCVSEHKACVVSPHMAPLYLAHTLLCRAELKPLVAIDGQLPDLIGAQHYVPKPDDGIVYIELSGPEKPANAPNMRWTPWDYCVGFYRLTGKDRRWLDFLATPTWIEFPEDYRPWVNPLMTEAEIEAALAAAFQMLDDGYGDKVVLHDPTGVLEPPWLGAIFYDPDANVFYQARGPKPADWRFVPPEDLVGSFWKVYDFFVGAPKDDPRDPGAGTRHGDAQAVRDAMAMAGIEVPDFGGFYWETVAGVEVYMVKLKFVRTEGLLMFAGFASGKVRPSRLPDGGLGFVLRYGVLTFGDYHRDIVPGETLGLRIEVDDERVEAFIDDKLIAVSYGVATKHPVVALFDLSDRPKPAPAGYDATVNRLENAT